MKLGIITPIGPGHEEAYIACSASIDAAIAHNKGLFTHIEKIAIPDVNGKLGRSAARNLGIKTACELQLDWIFFLDADDLLLDHAFERVAPFLERHDAIWGLICESPHDRPDQIEIRKNQLGETTSLQSILETDPFLSLQMGVFAKRVVVESVLFDEEMDAGEDFKFYLAVWRQFNCIKTNCTFFVNLRGNHSTGPRSADGKMWRTAVERALAAARKDHFVATPGAQNSMKLLNANTLILELGGERTFTVFNHWFWAEFIKDWEPQTWKFYWSFCIKGRPVIDIGSWIGPTALIAVASGASNVLLVEPNEATLRELRMTRAIDPELEQKWALMGVCVSDRDGMISFGTADGALRSSSASSDRGTGSKVAALRYEKIIEKIENPSIIKIDIEGTEIKILTDILKHSPKTAAIWLSWHPPLWEESGLTYQKLRYMFRNHHVLSADLEPIEISTLFEMISSSEKNPGWGTPYGNFFETAILNKKCFDPSSKLIA